MKTQHRIWNDCPTVERARVAAQKAQEELHAYAEAHHAHFDDTPEFRALFAANEAADGQLADVIEAAAIAKYLPSLTVDQHLLDLARGAGRSEVR